MQDAVESRGVPMHLWIVGILSLLWNGFGCTDYLMTRMRNADWIASMMPGTDPNMVFGWVDSFPMWAQFGWGLGVWMGLLGAALLLLRNRWAVHAMLLSLIGAVVGLGYQMADPMPGVTGFMAMGMPLIIIAVALGQYLYARAQRASGVLR
jgi:hypothetical protein